MQDTASVFFFFAEAINCLKLSLILNILLYLLSLQEL